LDLGEFAHHRLESQMPTDPIMRDVRHEWHDAEDLSAALRF
jgi:hypothetical protein